MARPPHRTSLGMTGAGRLAGRAVAISACITFALALSQSAAAADDFKPKYDALASDHAHDDTTRLHQLFDLDWEHGLQESPESATGLGDSRFDDRWTDMSREAIEARKASTQWPLAVIKSIDRAKLSKEDQLNYDLFRRDLEQAVEGERFPGELLVLSQMGGVHQSVAQMMTQMPTGSVKAYENILSRLRAAPRLIDQNIDLLRRGLAARVTPPRIILRDVPAQILGIIPDDPMKSALLKPFKEFPGEIPGKDQDRLRAEAVTIYKEQLAPAYRKLHEFVAKEYLPGARETTAWSQLPDGAAWYAFAVRCSTTTNMTPKEIHELGLCEVARIRAEMEKVIADAKFKGSFDDFLKFLRTDPRFFYKTPEDLLAGYRDVAKRIDPELARLFGKLPRLTYGVKAVPAYAEQSAPAAYYEGGSEKAGRPGWFLANTCRVETRPKWEMEALTLHEAVPGHHFQISLAQEMQGVPEFRKYNGYTAYVEGWGLYAESLGADLGLYRDPYSKYGALKLEMWRAARLVVDTGLHELGWSREKAIEFLMKNAGQEEYNATVEIDRYLAWPGQADAYKIGQLKIRELRRCAETELGEKFDVRAFHDELLAHGALPLDVLEATMKAWVAERKLTKQKAD